MRSTALFDTAQGSLLLEGVRVIDPSRDVDHVSSLGIHAARITEPERLPDPIRRMDCSGMVVCPGLCDLHAHLREPGATSAEDIDSGAMAAAHGGFTTVCAMPNTQPPLDDGRLIRRLTERAAQAPCRVRFIGTATRKRSGREVADIAEMREAGIVAVSDDGDAVTAESIEGVLAACRDAEIPLMEYPGDAALAGRAIASSVEVARRFDRPVWPTAAQTCVIDRDLEAAARTGARVHITQVSTAAGLDAIRRAKSAGVLVTCDVAPHHFAMTHAWHFFRRSFAWEDHQDTSHSGDRIDPLTRVNPPLTSRADALALLEGIGDGSVDAIATGHAPHPRSAKRGFQTAEPGLIGLESTLGVALAAVAAGRMTLSRMVSALSVEPARIVGERRSLAPGEIADLVLFDPAAEWTVSTESLMSKSTNTPLLGMSLPGRVLLTISGGRVSYSADVPHA